MDEDRRSLYARVLDLLTRVYLPALVAGHMGADHGRLAVELLGLCAVRTLTIGLLAVRCGNPKAPEEPAADGRLKSAQEAGLAQEEGKFIIQDEEGDNAGKPSAPQGFLPR